MIGYLKLGGLIAGALVLLALVLIINGWRKDAAQVPLLEERIEQVNQQIAQERKQVKDAQAASRGFQDELRTLREARAAAPARTVRLCTLSAAAPGPAVPVAQPGPDGATASAGGNAQGAGPDIGARLYAIADRCDDLSAQVRGLQDFVTRQAATPRPQ